MLAAPIRVSRPASGRVYVRWLRRSSAGFSRLGSLAQLVERHVYTVDVIGSIPVGPTRKPCCFRLKAEAAGFLRCPVFAGRNVGALP
jgi:hypothetical protein